MRPQTFPVRQRTQSELVQMPSRFPAVSTEIGIDTRMNVFAGGKVGSANPFVNGKMKVPNRNPKYMPKQRAHTATGYPNAVKHLEGI